MDFFSFLRSSWTHIVRKRWWSKFFANMGPLKCTYGFKVAPGALTPCICITFHPISSFSSYKSNTCAHHAIFRSLTLTQTCTSLTVSLRDQSFVEPFIRHLLSASSWKRRVLFPRVTLPRTTGRRQEAFHSATKVRWMTTLSYWDTGEVTGLEGIKTEKVGCGHVHLGALFFPFSLPLFISMLFANFKPPAAVCLHFLVGTLQTQNANFLSDISWEHRRAMPAYFRTNFHAR